MFLSTPPRSTLSFITFSSDHTQSTNSGSPNLVTPANSQTLSIAHGSPTQASTTRPARPLTPLDFFSSRQMQSRSEDFSPLHYPNLSDYSDSSDILHGPQPEHRPDVNPAIKGIPQGWEDDLTVPISAPQEQPRPSIIAVPPQRPNLDNRNHVRIKSFRGLSKGETRNKLSTWSANVRDKAFPELAEGRRRRMDLTAQAPRSESMRGGQKPMLDTGIAKQGSRNAAPNLLRRSSMSRASSFTAPDPQVTPNVPSRLGVSVHAHTDIPSTKASTTASTDDFEGLFTPSLPGPSKRPTMPRLSSDLDQSLHYAGSIASTHSSGSHRDRVMGLRSDPPPLPVSSALGGSKLFTSPKVDDVLPFTPGRMYSAWDHPSLTSGSSSASPVKGGPRVQKPPQSRRTSMTLSSETSPPGMLSSTSGFTSTSSALLVPTQSVNGQPEVQEGWKELPRARKGGSKKKIWIGADGEQVGGVYRVGWEREVLDMEARLHEAMYDLSGNKHTFVPIEDGQEPKNVLDIGTGLGLWPVSQALQWRETRFVGLDIVPCQIDLVRLAEAERRARSSSDGVPEQEGIWEGVEKRITWDRANFLTTLPYDTGVFDLVHIRFLALAIPESSWPQLLEEALRVLAPGGHLEITEMSIHLPLSAPGGTQRSFASLLLADMVNPDPSLPIKFALPMTEGLQSGMRLIFEGEAGEVGEEVAWTWVRSALEYKGSAGSPIDERKEKRLKSEIEGLWGSEKQAVGLVHAEDVGQGDGMGESTGVSASGAKIWAWVGKKKP